MTGTTWGVIIVILIIIFGGWYFLTRSSGTSSATTTNNASSTLPVTTGVAPSQGTVTSQGATITYSDRGFSPKSIAVPAGTTVAFVDQSTSGMWVASAPHPTHQGYDGTTRAEHCAAGYSGPKPFDQCASGTSFSFTFDKAGTWKYHNHTSPNDFGTIVVSANTSR